MDRQGGALGALSQPDRVGKARQALERNHPRVGGAVMSRCRPERRRPRRSAEAPTLKTAWCRSSFAYLLARDNLAYYRKSCGQRQVFFLRGDGLHVCLLHRLLLMPFMRHVFLLPKAPRRSTKDRLDGCSPRLLIAVLFERERTICGDFCQIRFLRHLGLHVSLLHFSVPRFADPVLRSKRRVRQLGRCLRPGKCCGFSTDELSA